jgi:geranylgeranyl diphosphate synthase type I
LREGKRTVLIALAQQELPPNAMRFMDEMLGNPDLDDAQIGTLIETLTSTGAVEKLEAIISEQIAGAQQLLETSGFSSNARRSLLELSHVVSRRQA